jgi:hypoxanthine-DNA glycosylase
MPDAAPQEPLPTFDALAPALPGRLEGLPPVVSAGTVVLVLGSFPGAASLRLRQYYAHPQNHFWKILQALWPQHALPPAGVDGYAARCEWLLARGVGLWDVYESCEREGSLDTSIRNARVNDFARLRAACPQLAAVAHNGGESFKHAAAVLESFRHLRAAARDGASLDPLQGTGSGVGAASPIASVRLPSTSPANASWSFERKLAAWAALMLAHRLL